MIFAIEPRLTRVIAGLDLDQPDVQPGVAPRVKPQNVPATWIDRIAPSVLTSKVTTWPVRSGREPPRRVPCPLARLPVATIGRRPPERISTRELSRLVAFTRQPQRYREHDRPRDNHHRTPPSDQSRGGSHVRVNLPEAGLQENNPAREQAVNESPEPVRAKVPVLMASV